MTAARRYCVLCVLVAAGTSSQDAIVEIATAKARMAALITAPLGVFGFMGAESAIVSSAIRRAGKPQGAANIIGKELAGEQLEEGLTQAGGNLATSTIDPNQSLMEGVPQAMGTAAVVSGPFAGMAVATEKLSGNRDEFAAGIDDDFEGIIERMKNAGVLEVNCD